MDVVESLSDDEDEALRVCNECGESEVCILCWIDRVVTCTTCI